jgi:aryl-alcohol dehydrogenase-like predicted oxidoreductase
MLSSTTWPRKAYRMFRFSRWEVSLHYSRRLQSSALDAAAAALEATPMQVALAWLLQRSPNILLIPGTSSLEHLRENLQSSMLQIPSEVIADLDAIGGNA